MVSRRESRGAGIWRSEREAGLRPDTNEEVLEEISWAFTK